MLANFRKDQTWKIYVFQFLTSLSFVGGVLVPFFTDWAELSIFQMQLLQSWFAIWVFILEVPTGVIADRYGAKKSVIIGTLVGLLGAGLYGIVANFWIFLLSEFILAMAIALISGADQALAKQILRDQGQLDRVAKVQKQAKNFGLVGLLVSAPIGSWLGANFGLNFPLLAWAVAFGLSAVLVMSIKVGARVQVKETQRMREILSSGVGYLWRHKFTRRLVLNSLPIALAGYFVVWFWQIVALDLGASIVIIGWIYVGMMSIQLIVQQVQTNLGRLTRGYALIVVLVTVAGFVAIGLLPNWWTLALFLVLAGGFGLTYKNIVLAEISQEIPEEDSGQESTILSAVSMIVRLSIAMANPVVGFLADRSLSWTLVGLGLFVLTSLIFLPRKEQLQNSG